MSSAFVDHCLELLAPLGPVRARRMFGGHGLYADDVFVALIANERLYLKTDADTEPRFAAAGCAAFIYEGQAEPVRMSYWSVPDEAMESPALMQPWARLAMQAAVKAAAAKAARPTREARATKTPAVKPGAKPAVKQVIGPGLNQAIKSAVRPTGHKPQAVPGAKPRAQKAKPRAPRRCPPAGAGVRRRPASGRPQGRRGAWA